jgi:hypothetical protein
VPTELSAGFPFAKSTFDSPTHGEVLATTREEPSAAERRFDEALTAQRAFIARDAVRAEIRIEAGTVLAAFQEATDDVGVREALALAGLLGRRAAELGCSGSELDAVAEALLTAIAPSEVSGLRGIMIEGYARSLIDREVARSLAARVATTRPFVVEPRVLALVLQGEPQPEWIAACALHIGPMLMRHDVRALIVIGRFGDAPTPAAVAELAAIADLGGVVGARVLFDVEAPWAEALTERAAGRAIVTTTSTLTAFELALGESAPVRARVSKLLRYLGA